MSEIWCDVDIALTLPVNVMPLIDDTDFKTREVAIAYDASGMDLVWNFQTTAGVQTQTAVTPTTAGDYDWTHVGDGMYKIEMTASGGASINNDTEGFGWFSGFVTGVLPWRGPIIGFRAVAINNALIDGGDNLDVNTVQVGGTSQTANDNSADINTILSRIIGTLAAGTHNPATAAQIAVLSDWIDAGRLDNLLDAIPTTAMRGTDGANTTVPDAAGTAPTAAEIVTAIGGAAIEDYDVQGNWGWAIALMVYSGPDGPGIYIDSGAANTNTIVGTDGTEINPVSTFAAARTLADALGLKIYYLEGNSDITLAATHVDWEFIGIGSVLDNIVNLGSQDVSRSLFRNLALEGPQGGAGRITARDCALQDPGAGTSTFHIFAERCGFVDEFLIDTSNDNVFDSCYSLVAGTGTPLVTATGAAGTVSFRHHSGSVELKALSASHNVTFEGIGNVVFNADCNVNATVSLKGIGVITDNTAGMSNLDEVSFINMAKINAEADTAISDAALATAANLATVGAVADGIQADLSNATDGLGALKTLIDTVNTDLSNGTDGLGALKTLIDALNNISAANVLTQVNAALDTAIAELGVAVPTATPTVRTALILMYMALRNKTIVQTSGTDALEIHNDAGTKIASKLLTDDGSDLTEAEMV